MFSVLDLFGGFANILRKKFLLLAGFVHKLVLLFSLLKFSGHVKESLQGSKNNVRQSQEKRLKPNTKTLYWNDQDCYLCNITEKKMKKTIVLINWIKKIPRRK